MDAARDGRSGGSGLGLSIDRAVYARLGGRVSAANGASGGARFEVRLPVSDSARPQRLDDAELSGSGTP